MKITYIYHSCFAVEMETAIFVFDYFKGELPEFDPKKKLYVFSSHKHHDHFTMEIFERFKGYEDCKFILSKDIKLSANYLERHHVSEKSIAQIQKIGKNETLMIEEGENPLKIETLTSTDEGVAFIVTYEGKTIYHAGDLNWWSWQGETEEEYTDMTSRFMKEMKKIEGRHFDVAFVVLDPRQEERYWWGFDCFMRATDTDAVFPMHCWERYEIIDEMLKNEKAADYREKIYKMDKEGMERYIK